MSNCIGPTNITPNNNQVILQDVNKIITITDNDCCNEVNVVQPITNVIQVSTPGPQGSQGPQGPPGSGSGGGIPGGLDTQIQFNYSGSFSGSNFFTYNYKSESLQQGSGSIDIGTYSVNFGKENSIGYLGYLSTIITNSIVILDRLYGDVTSQFIDTHLIIDDSSFQHIYGKNLFNMESSSFNTNTGCTEILLNNIGINDGSSSIFICLNPFPLGADQKSNTVFSLIQGLGNYVLGNFAHAEGIYSYAIGQGSHAEGSSQAIGVNSHAEGISNYAVGDYSHAEGYDTIASGNASHTEGGLTEAIGTNSHAEGFGTIASGSNQLAIGQWNTHNNTTDLFIVGNGISDSNRSDILRVGNTLVSISGSLDVKNGITASLYGTASYSLSSSYSFTSSYSPNYVLNSVTSSFITSTQTGSFVRNSQTGSFVVTSSFNSFTGSFNTGSFTGSFTGSLLGTSSWAQSASYAVSGEWPNVSIASSENITLGNSTTTYEFIRAEELEMSKYSSLNIYNMLNFI